MRSESSPPIMHHHCCRTNDATSDYQCVMCIDRSKGNLENLLNIFESYRFLTSFINMLAKVYTDEP